LTSNSQSTITIPWTLTKNVKKRDFYLLLEAQRVEHLLIDTITSSVAPNIPTQYYYSEVLMAQRLQRAELEVELYRRAIAKDGLNLLEGVHNFILNYVSTWKILIDNQTATKRKTMKRRKTKKAKKDPPDCCADSDLLYKLLMGHLRFSTIYFLCLCHTLLM
jgi:hypothetical protein